jgi:hypothetical protein
VIDPLKQLVNFSLPFFQNNEIFGDASLKVGYESNKFDDD